MNNLTTTQEKPVYNPYPNQARWIEEKFGHLRPIIKAAGRIVEKENKPCCTQLPEAFYFLLWVSLSCFGYLALLSGFMA